MSSSRLLLKAELSAGGVLPAPALLRAAANGKGKRFEKIKIVKMNGLRVYINPDETDALGAQSVFYSRRSDGPYYRWRYKEELGQWRGSRVHLDDVAHKAL